MSRIERLRADMRLLVIGAPMLIVSNPERVIAQCTSGIVGSFPALNARPPAQLPVWLERVTDALAAGVVGSIVVCVGVGGHAGTLMKIDSNPIEVLRETRSWS